MSDTDYEYLGDGYYVCIQYCEYVYTDGKVCNVYLGVNYPSDVCDEHRHIQS